MSNGWPTIVIDGAASLKEQEQGIRAIELNRVARLISLERALVSGERKVNLATFEEADVTEKVGQLKMIEIGRESPLGELLFQAEIYVEGNPTKVAVFR